MFRNYWACVATIGVLATACSDGAIAPAAPANPQPTPEIATVRLSVDVPDFPALAPSSVRATFKRQDGTIALDTSLALPS